jgi:uncharacterized surface protein with fasciclin (FAS1) repeats
MTTRARLALVLPVAALVLAAGACGSDDDNSASTTAAAEAPATEAPATEAPMTEAPMTEAPGTDAAAAGTIVDVAASNPDFSTLVTAVEAAGLAETLSGDGPFTVFAPTNEAFAAVPPEVLESLLADQEALTKVLTYHVLPGQVMAADVAPGDVATVEGSMATITDDGGTLKIGDATIVATDVAASNGVIHVIDAVLIPPTVDVNAL